MDRVQLSASHLRTLADRQRSLELRVSEPSSAAPLRSILSSPPISPPQQYLQQHPQLHPQSAPLSSPPQSIFSSPPPLSSIPRNPAKTPPPPLPPIPGRSISPGDTDERPIPYTGPRRPSPQSSRPFSRLASLHTRIAARPKPAVVPLTCNHSKREAEQTQTTAFPEWRESSYGAGSGSCWAPGPPSEVPPMRGPAHALCGAGCRRDRCSRLKTFHVSWAVLPVRGTASSREEKLGSGPTWSGRALRAGPSAHPPGGAVLLHPPPA